MDKDNCSRHSKQVAGIVDMKILAEAVGDLHYETLSRFLEALSDKLHKDGGNDILGKRINLGCELKTASGYIQSAANNIHHAWQISKPFMDKPDNNG